MGERESLTLVMNASKKMRKKWGSGIGKKNIYIKSINHEKKLGMADEPGKQTKNSVQNKRRLRMKRLRRDGGNWEGVDKTRVVRRATPPPNIKAPPGFIFGSNFKGLQRGLYIWAKKS